jgi:hypothetical protein
VPGQQVSLGISDFVARRPWASAAVALLALAVALQAGYSLASNAGQARPWLGSLVVAFSVYAAGAVWYFARHPHPDPGVALVSLGSCAVPTMASLPCAFFGAPTWSLAAAFGASCVLLVANALRESGRRQEVEG